jgi:hypothetical protein
MAQPPPGCTPACWAAHLLTRLRPCSLRCVLGLPQRLPQLLQAARASEDMTIAAGACTLISEWHARLCMHS